MLEPSQLWICSTSYLSCENSPQVPSGLLGDRLLEAALDVCGGSDIIGTGQS
jgi:hypothetical protein